MAADSGGKIRRSESDETFSPAGIEHFFEETLERAADPNQPPPSDNHEAVAARYVAAAPRYGMEFVG